MSCKSKGINAEREIIHMFWGTEDWCSHRIAGSGSSKYPSPDIIAGNNQRMIALECKTLKKGKKYLNQEEIKQLKDFSKKFGAEPWLAMKFDRQPWSFLRPEDLEETKSCFAISQNLIKKKGISFQELISNQKI
jgi:Holliday junction resolvase